MSCILLRFQKKLQELAKKLQKVTMDLQKVTMDLQNGGILIFFFLFILKSLFQDGRKLSQLYASFLIPVPPFPITNGYIRRHLEDIFMYPTGLLCGGLEGLSLA